MKNAFLFPNLLKFVCQLQDFYVDKHWETMPKSWIQTLTDVPPEYLSDLLISPNQNKEKIVWPLSLLALRRVLQRLCISRTSQSSSESNGNHNRTSSVCNGKEDTQMNGINANNEKGQFDCLTHPKIKTILTKKNIKVKKRHEIELMGSLTADVARESDVKYIIDFGAGLGHLARLLAYGYRLNVCCLERDSTLIEQAQ